MGLYICCGKGSDEEALDYDNISNYEGEKKLGKRHGKGIYYFENGDIYDGQWEWGKKHGYGRYTYADGRKKFGFYFNDEYLGENPGNLFARKQEEKDPAKPLKQENYQTFRHDEPSEKATEAMERRQKKREEFNQRQQTRRKHREDMKKKYNLA